MRCARAQGGAALRRVRERYRGDALVARYREVYARAGASRLKIPVRTLATVGALVARLERLRARRAGDRGPAARRGAAPNRCRRTSISSASSPAT